MSEEVARNKFLNGISINDGMGVKRSCTTVAIFIPWQICESPEERELGLGSEKLTFF